MLVPFSLRIVESCLGIVGFTSCTCQVQRYAANNLPCSTFRASTLLSGERSCIAECNHFVYTCLMHVMHACRQGNLKGVGASVAYFTVSPNGHKGVSHPVDVQATQMMHDFAVTENFAIFMDHAFVFDAKHMRKGNSIPYRC